VPQVITQKKKKKKKTLPLVFHSLHSAFDSSWPFCSVSLLAALGRESFPQQPQNENICQKKRENVVANSQKLAHVGSMGTGSETAEAFFLKLIRLI